jgi:hypothetical protein
VRDSHKTALPIQEAHSNANSITSGPDGALWSIDDTGEDQYKYTEEIYQAITQK